MTKKDYELIANVIRDRIENANNSIVFGYTSDEIDGWVAVISDLADMMAYSLKQENSKFDKEKFLLACGLAD